MEPDQAAFFPDLAAYLEMGATQVEGWLSPTSAAMIAHLLVRQSRDGLRGDVCEIGVHHGKLFLVLACAALENEIAVAVDIFGDQAKNIDASGAGDRAAFERHVARFAPAARVEIVQESSLDIAAHGFISRRFRFLSIDGGHTAHVTANDLRLAEATLCEGGIAALDDILSHEWTGVMAGLVDYLGGGGTLAPFALIPNKLLLADSRAEAERWRQVLRRGFGMAIAKDDLEFPGGMVVSFNEHAYYSRADYADLRFCLAEQMAANEALTATTEAASENAVLALRDAAGMRDTMSVELRMLTEAGADKDREIGRLRHEVGHWSRETERASRELRAIHASTSWRLTAPLRLLAGHIRSKPDRF